MSAFDAHQFQITCPHCGTGFSRTAGRLNVAKFIKCPGCRRRIGLNKTRFGLLDKLNAALALWQRARNWRPRR